MFYWDMFLALNAQRQVGPHGPQPYTVSDIKAYCDILGLNQDETSFAFDLVSALDSDYLVIEYAKIQERREREAREAERRGNK